MPSNSSGAIRNRATTIRRSDTLAIVAPVISAHANAVILRRAASTAVTDARAAWKKARAAPTEKHMRAAFRLCVFAAQALRKAAKAMPHDAPQMIEEAQRLDAAAIGLASGIVQIKTETEHNPPQA